LVDDKIVLLLTERKLDSNGQTHYWTDRIIEVDKLEAIKLKLEYGEDCFNLTDLRDCECQHHDGKKSNVNEN
jgi:hypothetical protein